MRRATYRVRGEGEFRDLINQRLLPEKRMKRPIVMGTLALVLVTRDGICARAAEQEESRKATSQFLGKDRVQIAKIMGEPKGTIPMTDTGGEMLFYSYQGPHYVLETNQARVGRRHSQEQARR